MKQTQNMKKILCQVHSFSWQCAGMEPNSSPWQPRKWPLYMLQSVVAFCDATTQTPSSSREQKHKETRFKELSSLNFISSKFDKNWTRLMKGVQFTPYWTEHLKHGQSPFSSLHHKFWICFSLHEKVDVRRNSMWKVWKIQVSQFREHKK